MALCRFTCPGLEAFWALLMEQVTWHFPFCPMARGESSRDRVTPWCIQTESSVQRGIDHLERAFLPFVPPLGEAVLPAECPLWMDGTPQGATKALDWPAGQSPAVQHTDKGARCVSRSCPVVMNLSRRGQERSRQDRQQWFTSLRQDWQRCLMDLWDGQRWYRS